MKKFLSFIFLCTLCFYLSACDPSYYYFKYDDLLSVVDIELIEYENTDQKHFFSWALDYYSKLVPFSADKMTIIETLDNEKHEYFFEELSHVCFVFEFYDYDSPKGICLRLLYENGDFLVLSCNYHLDMEEQLSHTGYVGKYDSNGDVIEFIGCFDWTSDFQLLVNDFFETQI